MRVLILSIAFIVTGCATPLQKSVSEKIGLSHQQAEQHHQQLRSGSPEVRTAIWLGDTVIELDDPVSQPAWLDRSIPVYADQPKSLTEHARYVASQIELPVRVTRAAADWYRGGEDQGSGSDSKLKIQLHDITVSALLDHLAIETGNAWRFDARGVEVYRFDTRSWQVPAFPGTATYSASITNQTQSSQSGGGGDSATTSLGGGQNTQIQGEIDVFSGIEESVQQFISPEGRFHINVATGTVVVTDIPAALHHLEDYFDLLTEQLSRSVIIDVQVASLELSDRDNYGLDLNLLYSDIDNSVGANLNLFGINGDNPNTAGFGVVDPGDNLSGTQLVLNALRAQGDLSIETTASVSTLNYQPVPLQVGRQTSFVSQSSTSLVADAGQITTEELSTITTGFTLRLLPIVLDHQRLQLQVEVNLDDLRDLVQQPSGIQAPIVDKRQTLQRIPLQSGQTIVISGFDQLQQRTDQRGSGKHLWLLGGKSRNEDRRTQFVILITPRIIA